MKFKRIAGRLPALVLALALALALAPAVPARAVDSTIKREINIYPNKYITTPTDENPEIALGQRFYAYQIFKGEIEDDPDADDYFSPNQNINKLKKETLAWGASMKEEGTLRSELMHDLADDPTPVSELGFTGAMMLETRGKYLVGEEKDTLFKHYWAEYKKITNWDDDNIGGMPTPAGRLIMQEAAQIDIDTGTISVGHMFRVRFDGYQKEHPGTNAEDAGAAITAADVFADFTPSTGNSALAQAFLAIVCAKVKDDNDEMHYKYVKEDEPFAISKWVEDGENSHWVIDLGEEDGYYMIRDTFPEDKKMGMANAMYMAGVYGYGDIYVKAEAPTMTKTIVDSGNGISGSFEVDQKISFRLQGTLPENFNNYYGYPYIFEDILEPGLKCCGTEDFKVFVETGSIRYPVYWDRDGDQVDGYRLAVEEVADGTKVTISFPDLKQLRNLNAQDQDPSEKPAVIPVTGSSAIYVEYTAALKETAALTNTEGYKNNATLYYANDPKYAIDKGLSWASYWDKAPTGWTQANVRVYDFGVQLTVYKKPENDGETSPLQGVGFALRRSTATAAGEHEFAILHRNEDTGAYHVAGWVPANQIYEYLYRVDQESDLQSGANSWDAPLPPGQPFGADGFNVPGEGYYISVLTGDNGAIRILGVGESSYTLEQVVIPDDSEGKTVYKTAGDITFDFSPTYNNKSGMLWNLTAYTEGSDVKDEVRQDIVQEGSFAIDRRENGTHTRYPDMVVPLTLYQVAEELIVETGGAGTTLFYIGGGALLVGAALFLVVSNVKKKPSGKGDR